MNNNENLNNNNANNTINTNNPNNTNNLTSKNSTYGYRNKKIVRKTIKNPIRSQEITIREPILIRVKELEEKEMYNYAFIHNENDNSVFYDHILAPA